MKHLKAKHRGCKIDVTVLSTEDAAASLPNYKYHVKTIPTLVKTCISSKYVCDTCPFTCNKRGAFWQHQAFHVGKQKGFKCNSCPFWVNTKARLSQHQKLHAPISIFEFHRIEDSLVPGSQCSWMFASEHYEDMTQSRDVKCLYCSLKMADVTAMGHHVITHVSVTEAVTARVLPVSLGNDTRNPGDTSEENRVRNRRAEELNDFLSHDMYGHKSRSDSTPDQEHPLKAHFMNILGLK